MINNMKLYEMKLGEIVVIEDTTIFTEVIRVPGGWIYRSLDKYYNVLSAVFVPFNNEFQT